MKNALISALMTFLFVSFVSQAMATNINGDIKANSFYDESYFMVSRTSIIDATNKKTTLSANKLGEEFLPQEGENKIGEDHSHFWNIESSTSCYANPQGETVMQRAISCKYYDGLSGVTSTVADYNCNAESRPSDFIRCYDQSQTYQWSIKNQGKCSSGCGEGVIQRQISCLKINSDTNKKEFVADNECIGFGLVKPNVTASCIGTSGCANRWDYSQFGNCNGLCGANGVMTREAKCLDNENNVIPNSECENLLGAPVLNMQCTPGCSNWSFSEWSECQASCFNNGVKTRDAYCKNSKGEVVDDTNCPGLRELLVVNEPCTKQCPAKTCGELFSNYPSLPNGAYPLVGPNGTFTATCDMTGGGWTLVPNLSFLSNFDNFTEIKGLENSQVDRLKVLHSGGMDAYINTTYSYSSGNQNLASFTKSFDVNLSEYGSFVKSNNLPFSMSITAGVNAYDKDTDQGNIRIFTYDANGVQLFYWQAGKGDYPQSYRYWTHVFTDSEISKLLLQHQCWRVTGSACSSAGLFYVYINTDLPKANFYIK